MIKRIATIVILGILFITISHAIPNEKAFIRSEKYMVVTNHGLATKAAQQVLDEGGNAVDAAVTAMFVLGVVEPWASGIGGGGYMMISDPHSYQKVVIDFREKAPERAALQIFYRDKDAFRYNAYIGYRSVCVPGMIAGVSAALDRYGTITQSAAVEPAIKIARNGFMVSERFNTMLWRYYDLIETHKATSVVFMPELVPVPVDEKMVRDDLAVTLETLALRDFRDFYMGVIADDIIAEFSRNDGILTNSDLRSYEINHREAIKTTYRDYTVFTTPLPSAGGISLAQVLNILESINIDTTEHNSGEYIHKILEACNVAYLDARKYGRDPDFYPVNVDRYLSDEHMQILASEIDSFHHSKDEYFNDSKKLRSRNSSPVCVIDESGMAVTVNQSINFFFGSQVTHPKYGILFNNGLYSFSQDSLSADRIEPGKKAVTNMFSTMIYRSGKPFLLINSTGELSSVIVVAHVICSIIDFNLDIYEAIDAPRFYEEDGFVNLETRIDSEAIEELKRRGHRIKLRTDYNTDFGLTQAIHILPGSEIMHGAADPRGEGIADGK